jgi:hypothetical protein
MIVDFHTHLLAPEDQAQFTSSKFHSQVLARPTAAAYDREYPEASDDRWRRVAFNGDDLRTVRLHRKYDA